MIQLIHCLSPKSSEFFVCLLIIQILQNLLREHKKKTFTQIHVKILDEILLVTNKFAVVVAPILITSVNRSLGVFD